MCAIGSASLSAELDALPGPGLDVPVDVDGDGISTYGDRYAFNYWLGAGGNLGDALFEAEAGKDGTIEVSKFFSSAGALLAPQSKGDEPESVEAFGAGGGGAAQVSSSSCVTSASIVAPFGEPTTPASLFTSCQSELQYPTGADMDSKQGLWCSRDTPPGCLPNCTPFECPECFNGVVLLNLSQVPPMGNDGHIQIESPAIATMGGFKAEGDIVIRKLPIHHCGGGGPSTDIHAISTWVSGALICPTLRDPDVPTGLCYTCSIVKNVTEPFAIDAVRDGMPAAWGSPEDLIFSDKTGGTANIRRAVTPVECSSDNSTVTTLATLSGVVKVWGLALGDFKGAGTFGAYFVAQTTQTTASDPTGRRVIRMLVAQRGGSFAVQSFASLTGLATSNGARSVAFDPVSGDLFVSEDVAVNLNGPQARIWRIGPSGVPALNSAPLFGKNFNKPNGIAFHPSGVMLVAEQATADSTQGNVLAVGGWRNLFKRGDANGDGTVNISDPIKISNWLQNQSAATAPACLDAADATDDGWVLQQDANLILDYLFSGGPPPSAPGPNTCGRDPSTTPDLLDCTLSLGAGCSIQ